MSLSCNIAHAVFLILGESNHLFLEIRIRLGDMISPGKLGTFPWQGKF